MAATDTPMQAQNSMRETLRQAAHTYNDLLGLNREPVRRNDGYHHRDQLKFYGTEENDDQFRIRYRFRKNTVRLLTQLLYDEIAPKATSNNADMLPVASTPPH